MPKILLALIVAAIGMVSVPASAADTIYVMRHLQKATGDDPPLTEEGATNAKLLVGQLGNAGIKGVFATATRRAAQTGEPLARAQGLTVTTYDPSNVPALTQQVKALSGNVLVVGHSNTVPDLVAAFGGTKPAPIPDTEYGTIYVVKTGSPAVTTMRVPPVPVTAAPERGR